MGLDAAAMRRDDETTFKSNDTMAAARCYDDEAMIEKNDTMETVRCDEEKTETMTGRLREFSFTLGEIPRGKVTIGSESNASTSGPRQKQLIETQEGAKSQQERLTHRDVDPRWAHRETRRAPPWCRVEDIRTQVGRPNGREMEW